MDAIDRLFQCRPVINPRVQFLRQLAVMEKIILAGKYGVAFRAEMLEGQKALRMAPCRRMFQSPADYHSYFKDPINEVFAYAPDSQFQFYFEGATDTVKIL